MVHTKNLHNVKMKIQSGGGDDPGYIEKTTDAISNVHGSIKSNPHISLFLLPIIVYGCIYIYDYFLTGEMDTRDYSLISYVSFIIFGIGYWRYCISKQDGGNNMIFYIALYLIITSVIALSFCFYKIIMGDDENSPSPSTIATPIHSPSPSPKPKKKNKKPKSSPSPSPSPSPSSN